MQMKLMIFDVAGHVGSHITSQFMRLGHTVVLIDIIDIVVLAQRAARLQNDAFLAIGLSAKTSVYGNISALKVSCLTRIIYDEQPDLVINYAIPITWDAAKKLFNYARISALVLGAFTTIQVMTPLLVAKAIVAASIDTRFMIGNLPGITVPIVVAVDASGPHLPGRRNCDCPDTGNAEII